MDSLTHWGRVTLIYISKLTTIGSDNGLAPDWRQAINWTNDGILLIGPLGTNFSQISIKIHTSSFKKIHLNMLFGKLQPFCLSLNVLTPLVLKWEPSERTGSISWLMMPWLLRLPWQQQPWYWICRISWSLSSMRNNFNYLYHLSIGDAHI